MLANNPALLVQNWVEFLSEVGEGLDLTPDHSNLGRARSFRKRVMLKIRLKGRAPAVFAKEVL